MPGLNLLTEDDLNFRGILLADQRQYRGINRVEHLCREWADIVEIEFNCMQSRHTGRRELLAGEFRCESHFYNIYVRRKLV